MKILILKDKKLGDISEMFESLRESYKDVTDVEWIEREIDGDLPFEIYYGNNYGLSKSHIAKTCKELWGEYRYTIDHVIWCFARTNWKAPGIGGWNMGRLYSNYAVQQVLCEQAGKWAGKTLEMEVAHAFDELAPSELNISLDRLVGMDWDNDVVHGEHPDWGVKRFDGTYFTDYDYTKLIRTFADKIARIYKVRRAKEELVVAQLSLIKLLKLWIQRLLAKPTPAPLEGNHHIH